MKKLFLLLILSATIWNAWGARKLETKEIENEEGVITTVVSDGTLLHCAPNFVWSETVKNDTLVRVDFIESMGYFTFYTYKRIKFEGKKVTFIWINAIYEGDELKTHNASTDEFLVSEIEASRAAGEDMCIRFFNEKIAFFEPFVKYDFKWYSPYISLEAFQNVMDKRLSFSKLYEPFSITHKN